MGLPPANLVLFFLSAFVVLWGASLLVRGARARRDAGSRHCPECARDMRSVEGRRCPACAFEAGNEDELRRRGADFRVVGLGAVALSAGIVLIPVAVHVRAWEGTGNDQGLGVHPLNAVFAGVGAFGIVLAAWAWRGDRSRGRRRCPSCWYDMSATLPAEGIATSAALVCPECGHDAGSPRRLYRARRRTRLAWLGVSVALLGLCGQVVPRMLRVGPLGAVPTTVLIAGVGWLPMDWLEAGRVPNGSLESRMIERNVLPGWQAQWLKKRAAAELAHTSDPRRLAFLLRLAETQDSEVASGAISRVCELLLSSGESGWTAAETDLVIDAVRHYASGVVWARQQAIRTDEPLRPLDIPGDLVAELLRNSSATRAELGITLAGAARSAHPEVWAALWRLAQVPDRRISYSSAWTIWDMTQADGRALEWWMEASRSPDGATRALAAAVARNGQAAGPIGERLMELLRDSDINVALRAAEALTVCSVPPGRWAAAVEAEFLGAREHRARFAEALVAAWDVPQCSYDILAKACADPEPVVRAAAIWAMPREVGRGRGAPESAMELAAELLDDEDERVRRIAATVVLIVAADDSAQAEAHPDAVARARAMDTFGVVFDETEFEEP